MKMNANTIRDIRMHVSDMAEIFFCQSVDYSGAKFWAAIF